jgi:hypothetical protein
MTAPHKRTAEREHRRQSDRLTIAQLMAHSADWLRHQRRLIRRALRAKRRQGGKAS